MQVYNLSQNVQEDDLQHLQVRPLSLLLCITEVAVLLSALASCVALQRHFRIHSHKIFFSFPALILVHGQGGTVTWFETCLAYALTVWLLGAWVLWQGSQWDICQEGLFLSLRHMSSLRLITCGAGRGPRLCFVLQRVAGGHGEAEKSKAVKSGDKSD